MNLWGLVSLVIEGEMYRPHCINYPKGWICPTCSKYTHLQRNRRETRFWEENDLELGFLAKCLLCRCSWNRPLNKTAPSASCRKSCRKVFNFLFAWVFFLLPPEFLSVVQKEMNVYTVFVGQSKGEGLLLRGVRRREGFRIRVLSLLR